LRQAGHGQIQYVGVNAQIVNIAVVSADARLGERIKFGFGVAQAANAGD